MNHNAPAIMGILNVTPDSFSDGGHHHGFDAALSHAEQLRADGADIIDVGGESTRPGSDRVEAADELARTAGVVEALVDAGAEVSIDTTRSEVAATAVSSGASIINDVSGGVADPDMASLVARTGCRIVLMHWRGHSADMYAGAQYQDVVAEVKAELLERVETMRSAGVATEQIILDPGIGFAKLDEHNWTLMAHLDDIVDLGYPVLFGASRKGFLGRALSEPSGQTRPAAERDMATQTTSVLAFEAGAWGVRVHDVAGACDARAVWQATRRTR